MKWLVVVGVALLLLGCGRMAERIPSTGRYQVDLVVVNRVPFGFGARVASPSRIEILREYKRDEVLVAHELCHIVQWNLHGHTFPVLYASHWLVWGYDDMPLERACKRTETDEWYLEWARDLIREHFG